jgi:hypothetical protein
MKKIKIILLVIAAIVSAIVIIISVGFALILGLFTAEFTDVEVTHIDGNKMTIVHDLNGSAGINWEYEVYPEEIIELMEKDRRIVYLSPAGEEIWRFQSVSPGDFTMCWIRYTGGSNLDSSASYAQNYTVTKYLKIEEIGEPYPIWEVEGCKAVVEHIERVRYSLEERLNDDFYNEYEGVTYEVIYDTETEVFFIMAVNTDYNDDDVRKFAFDFSYNVLTPDDGLFSGYTIDVKIVDQNE